MFKDRKELARDVGARDFKGGAYFDDETFILPYKDGQPTLSSSIYYQLHWNNGGKRFNFSFEGGIGFSVYKSIKGNPVTQPIDLEELQRFIDACKETAKTVDNKDVWELVIQGAELELADIREASKAFKQ